jgi:hypothetical protein
MHKVNFVAFNGKASKKKCSTLFKVPHYVAYKTEYPRDLSFKMGYLEKTVNLENISECNEFGF